MENGEPADHGVELSVCKRIGEGVAEDMRDAFAESGALRKISGDGVELGLELVTGSCSQAAAG